jgi:hypothetical protein
MSFTGGDKLKARLEEIARMAGKADVVNVGFLEGATYPESEGGLPVAAVAAVQEYGGSITVPEHTTTINRNITKSGDLKNGGKFVKAEKANYQTQHIVPEYTITIPARPYFRSMIAANKGDWGPQLGKIIKSSNYDSNVALGRMGENVKGQLQQSIRDMKDPPNAKSTVAQKGFDDPLVKSGHMLNSVDWEVKGGE